MIGRRHKRTVRDRESGLVFSWRVRQASRLRMGFAMLVVVAVTGFVGAVVSVRVAPSPKMLERKAEVLAMPAGVESVEWQVRCDEAGPFPSRFDPSALPVVNDEIERQADRLSRPEARYRAMMREFPKEESIIYPPSASKGERVLPERTNRDEQVPDTGTPMRPRLRILANLPTGAEPVSLPAFPEPDSPGLTAATWRFVIRVSGVGRVTDCMPTPGAGTVVPGEVENWVRSVRFGSKAAAAGWFGIEVGFVREP